MNKPEIIVVSTSKRYRKLARTLSKRTDYVLEVGFSTGETTAILSKQAKQILAVEIDERYLTKVSEKCADNVNVQLLDGRNLDRLKELIPNTDLIFIDINGNAPPENAVTLVNMYLSVWSPRAIVLRNIRLAQIVELVSELEFPEYYTFRDQDKFKQGSYFSHYAELAKSYSGNNRLFAARKIVDFDVDESEKNDKEKVLSELEKDQVARVRWALAKRTKND